MKVYRQGFSYMASKQISKKWLLARLSLVDPNNRHAAAIKRLVDASESNMLEFNENSEYIEYIETVLRPKKPTPPENVKACTWCGKPDCSCQNFCIAMAIACGIIVVANIIFAIFFNLIK